MTIEKSVVLSDIHYPFQDKKAVKLALKFIKEFQPDIIFLNGDIIDCWEISSFTRPLHIDHHLKEEINQVSTFIYELRSTAPKAKIIYIFGNHENRWERYIAKNSKELFGLKGLTLEEQLDLKSWRIQVVNTHQKENYYRYGKLLIGHFNKVNRYSGYTAKNLLEDKGLSLIQAHTHRLGSSYKRDYGGSKVALENGCLCNLNPPYCSIPNWQIGFTTIHKDTQSDFFKACPVEIVKYRIFYGDKIISL